MHRPVEAERGGLLAERLRHARVGAQEMMQAAQVIDVLPPDLRPRRPIAVLVEATHSQRRDGDQRLALVVVFAAVSPAGEDVRQPGHRLLHVAAGPVQDVLDVTADQLELRRIVIRRRRQGRSPGRIVRDVEAEVVRLRVIVARALRLAVIGFDQRQQAAGRIARLAVRIDRPPIRRLADAGRLLVELVGRLAADRRI